MLNRLLPRPGTCRDYSTLHKIMKIEVIIFEVPTCMTRIPKLLTNRTNSSPLY